MVEIWTGGQTGIDQAAWRAAAGVGLATGGWMPRHFTTEGGCRPEFREMYNAREHGSPHYRPRTIANVREAAAVLLIGEQNSAGSRVVLEAAAAGRKPLLAVKFRSAALTPAQVAAWLLGHAAKDRGPLLVAGNRGSSIDVGTMAWAEQFLIDVFQALKARLS